jgi:hypothetical protein
LKDATFETQNGMVIVELSETIGRFSKRERVFPGGGLIAEKGIRYGLSYRAVGSIVSANPARKIGVMGCGWGLAKDS